MQTPGLNLTHNGQSARLYMRGPQGTLYGRNSTGGTINLITKKPEAESSAKLVAEVGSYNYRSLGGMINGVISEDKVLDRLAVMKTEHDPCVKNIAATGIDGLLDDDSLATRGALRFLLDDESELMLRADCSDIDRNPEA